MIPYGDPSSQGIVGEISLRFSESELNFSSTYGSYLRTLRRDCRTVCRILEIFLNVLPALCATACFRLSSSDLSTMFLSSNAVTCGHIRMTYLRLRTWAIASEVQLDDRKVGRRAGNTSELTLAATKALGYHNSSVPRRCTLRYSPSTLDICDALVQVQRRITALARTIENRVPEKSATIVSTKLRCVRKERHLTHT